MLQKDIVEDSEEHVAPLTMSFRFTKYSLTKDWKKAWEMSETLLVAASYTPECLKDTLPVCDSACLSQALQTLPLAARQLGPSTNYPKTVPALAPPFQPPAWHGPPSQPPQQRPLLHPRH